MKYSGKLLLLLFITSFITLAVDAQTKSNHAFLEVFGNGGAYSLNYERHIVKNITARVGFTAVPSASKAAVGIPLIGNYHIFVGRNYFEAGLGATYYSAPLDFGKLGEKDAEDFIPTGVIAYCMNSSKSGLILRVAFTPFYYDEKFIPFGGVSFGFTF